MNIVRLIVALFFGLLMVAPLAVAGECVAVDGMNDLMLTFLPCPFILMIIMVKDHKYYHDDNNIFMGYSNMGILICVDVVVWTGFQTPSLTMFIATIASACALAASMYGRRVEEKRNEIKKWFLVFASIHIIAISTLFFSIVV